MNPFQRFIVLRLRDSFDWSSLRSRIPNLLQECGFGFHGVTDEDEGFMATVTWGASTYEIGFRFDVSQADEGGVVWIQTKRRILAAMFAPPEKYRYPDLEQPLLTAISSVPDIQSATWHSYKP